MCIVCTSRIAYRGADRLDTTVKSGSGLGKLLAPTWALVGGIKHHETHGSDPRWLRYAPITQTQYVDGYYALIRERYKADTMQFSTLLQRDRIVLCCYCISGFCHRYLAADILSKIAAHYGLPVTAGGELTA